MLTGFGEHLFYFSGFPLYVQFRKTTCRQLDQLAFRNGRTQHTVRVASDNLG